MWLLKTFAYKSILIFSGACNLSNHASKKTVFTYGYLSLCQWKDFKKKSLGCTLLSHSKVPHSSKHNVFFLDRRRTDTRAYAFIHPYLSRSLLSQYSSILSLFHDSSLFYLIFKLYLFCFISSLPFHGARRRAGQRHIYQVRRCVGCSVHANVALLAWARRHGPEGSQ